MNHRVAIGAHRYEVVYGVNFIFLPHFRDLDLVMNMNEAGTSFPKVFFTVETTHCANSSKFIEACTTGRWIPLISINKYGLRSTLYIGGYFIGEVVWFNSRMVEPIFDKFSYP